MDFIQSVLMGIVQGLSEFLPISSSAHLVFTSNFYKAAKGAAIAAESNQEIFLDIMLHLGTLAAVLIFFRKDIAEIIKALYYGIKVKKGDYNCENFKTGIYIIIGTVITILVAYPLKEFAENLVFKPALTGCLLVLTGCLLLLAEVWNSRQPDKKNITFKSAVIIGIAQGLAVLPGFSRSGLTVSAGLFGGAGRTTAARYSFLLSIPVILGASMIYPLIKLDFTEIAGYNWDAIIAGTVVSGVTGYFCIKYFLKFISEFSLSVFGYYCVIAGLAVSIFFFCRSGV